jgi:hypothetical protein
MANVVKLSFRANQRWRELSEARATLRAGVRYSLSISCWINCASDVLLG